MRFTTALAGIALCGFLAFTGCATIGADDEGPADNQPVKADQTSAPAPDENKIAVESVRSSSDGTRVIISTSGSVKYTVFKLNDPPRLIIDMPNVDMSRISKPMDVKSDLVQDVNVVPMAEGMNIGRVVLGLKDGVEHKVMAGANMLLVTLSKPAPAPEEAASSAKASDVNAEEVATPVEGAAPVEPVAEETARPATGITGITSSSATGNTVLTISMNGAPVDYNAFALDKPTRIVIDVMGIKNMTGKSVFRLNEKHIKSVRIGAHKDKVRLVVDASDKKLPRYAIAKDGKGLVLNMGANAVAQAAPAPAPPVAVAAKEAASAQAVVPSAQAVTDESAQVTLVDYRKLNGNGRLTIVRSKKTDIKVEESPDGKTLMLDLMNATLIDELKRTLDATRLNTPVVAVSSYQESETPVKDVRILVKLVDKTSYEVKESETSVSVDFLTPVTDMPVAEGEKKQETDVTLGIEATSGEVADIGEKPKVFTGKKISIDMVDANIHDIFRLIAAVSNFNIIASDDVKGTITLSLKDVPWDQAFDILLKSKDLGISRIGNVIRVAPAATLRKEKESTLAAKKAQEKLDPLDIKFIPINFATATDLATHVKAVLSERGSVTSETRTNTLIVKDIKQGIADAEKLISKLDNPIPQVQIEARIVEAESSFTRDLGIQWGLDYKARSDSTGQTNIVGSTSQTGQDAVYPSQQTGISETSVTSYGTGKGKDWVYNTGVTNYAVNLPATNTLGALGFIIGRNGTNPFILDLRLSAGEASGRLKTISRPRVTTLDNKEAKIEQGESIPFETSSASGTTTTFIDANLSLTVTPHITPDGSVLMKIKASRNSIGTFRTSSGAPSINKKEAATEVLVLDGETTVIGGIIVSDKNDSESGIPYLMDIPLLGWLFKNKHTMDNQKELLIFITPTIIKDKAV